MATSYAKREWSWELNVKKGSANESSVKVVVWDSSSTTPVVNTTTDSNGKIATQYLVQEDYTMVTGTSTSVTAKTPHVVSIVKYGLVPFSVSINFNASRNDTIYMRDNDYITESSKSTVDAYTGISINHSTQEITVSSNHTWAQIYDYTQSDAYDNPDKSYPAGIVSTSDGVTYLLGSGWNLIVNDGVTVSADDITLVFDGGEWDLNSSGNFTGIMNDGTNYRVPIKITNLVANSIVYIKKTSDETPIFKQTVSGTSHTIYYTETSDTEVLVRVRNASGTQKYKTWETTVIVTKTAGATVQVSQQKDE